MTKHLIHLVLGIIFGIILVKSEVVSWFRIQEMFHFHSIHMYGVMGCAVLVGVISVTLLKKLGLKSIDKEELDFEPKPYQKGFIYGGILFGLGWAMTGACPGPLYALIGSGFSVLAVSLVSALAGAWAYGWLRDKLPH
jgi:uncharacterized membrane protein YedE/YeeE